MDTGAETLWNLVLGALATGCKQKAFLSGWQTQIVAVTVTSVWQ